MNNQDKLVLLSLGSNLGDKRFNIDNAIKLLKDNKILYDVTVSSYYLTEPLEVKNQPEFLNAALIGKHL